MSVIDINQGQQADVEKPLPDFSSLGLPGERKESEEIKGLKQVRDVLPWIKKLLDDTIDMPCLDESGKPVFDEDESKLFGQLCSLFAENESYIWNLDPDREVEVDITATLELNERVMMTAKEAEDLDEGSAAEALYDYLDGRFDVYDVSIYSWDKV